MPEIVLATVDHSCATWLHMLLLDVARKAQSVAPVTSHSSREEDGVLFVYWLMLSRSVLMRGPMSAHKNVGVPPIGEGPVYESDYVIGRQQ